MTCASENDRERQCAPVRPLRRGNDRTASGAARSPISQRSAVPSNAWALAGAWSKRESLRGNSGRAGSTDGARTDEAHNSGRKSLLPNDLLT